MCCIKRAMPWDDMLRPLRGNWLVTRHSPLCRFSPARWPVGSGRVSLEVAHVLVPQGRQRIAWGASPRDNGLSRRKPRRGDTQRGVSGCRPCGALRPVSATISWGSRPRLFDVAAPRLAIFQFAFFNSKHGAAWCIGMHPTWPAYHILTRPEGAKTYQPRATPWVPVRTNSSAARNGRQSIARGASPWKRVVVDHKPRRGESLLLLTERPAISCRPFRAKPIWFVCLPGARAPGY